MLKNSWCFLALCLLGVKAQNSTDAKVPESLAVTGSETIKVEPAKISALYIGDLLRTKRNDDLEASGSVHRPVISKQAFLSPSPVAGRSFNYKAHGGHEYLEKEYIHPPTESRAHSTSSVKRVGNTARNVPVNVLGHLLTLKPVRVVSADVLQTARDSGVPHKNGHYPNDDCSKSGEHSYSSEEKLYVPEQRTYRRAKQIAPNPVPEYRSPQGSYSDEDRPDRYYSHSDPSTGTYDSKSHASDTDTKSHSTGSYTRSKSTSTSRTVTPTRSKQTARIIPTAVSPVENYEKDLGPAHGDQGVIVYKVKEPASSHRPSSYSNSADRDYPPSSYEREPKSGPREPEYTQHPSDVRKPRKQSHEVRSHHSTTGQQLPKERPQQYGPAHYEQDRDSYEQSSYPPAEQRYRQQNKPSSSYHQEPDYVPQPDARGQEQQKPYYQNYQAPESAASYEAEQPSKPQSSKRHRGSHYERPSSEGRENTRYRAQEPSTPEYNYPQEHQIQSSRSGKERQSSYETYPSQDGHPETSPAPQSYERSQPALRPSEEKRMNQYVYEATPHQTTIKHGHSHRPSKRQYRESSRSARSPEKHMKSVIVEERAHLPGVGKEPVIMVSRESKPYVSRSVSYSESKYNMGENEKPNAKLNYREQEQFQATEGRQVDDTDYQTSYKPYNSEYPASYANDQHNNAAAQHQSQTYQQPYDRPHSYEETPQQYQPYHEEQPYEQDGPQDDSYEQGDEPVKKDKNHHYISNIEGYKDTYGYNEPLTIDDEFFRKYGISKTAKVIVATAQNPNLFVADGTGIKEGGNYETSGPSEQGNYEPNYKNNFREDSSSESPEELGVPKEIPGSFDDLVDTNPRFLRKLPQIMRPSDGYFKMESSDASFDDVEFRDAGEPKGFIVSQGPREIVQQHGDGVSRIIFNVPKDESKAESSIVPKVQHYNDQDDEKLIEAATKVIENILNN